MPVFEGQYYYIANSIPQERQAELIISLDQNGGTQCTSLDDENLNVVITNANDFDGRSKVKAGAVIVTVSVLWETRYVDAMTETGGVSRAGLLGGSLAVIWEAATVRELHSYL